MMPGGQVPLAGRNTAVVEGQDVKDKCDLYIIGRFCLSVTFLLIPALPRSVFMVFHGSRSVFMAFHGSGWVFMVPGWFFMVSSKF